MVHRKKEHGELQEMDGWWYKQFPSGGWRRHSRVRAVMDPTRTRAGADTMWRLMYHKF